MQPTRVWDLNIFFRDLGHDENGDNQWDDVLTIAPTIYEVIDGVSNYIDTDLTITCTFSETRWIVSQRKDYGDDWFESLDHFLMIAPPRLSALLKALPDLVS
jgi:hypothetical protein